MRRLGFPPSAAAWALAAALLALSSAALAAPAAAAGDGSLTRLKGRAGCLSASGERGCTPARGLGEPRGVAVSPGGGSVYVTSAGANTVAVFRRSSRTGALRQLRGRAGCLRQRGGRRCGRARALRGAGAIAVSGDGRSVYVLGSKAIAVFRRSARTGAVRQLRGSAGCVSDRRAQGCRDGRAIAHPSGLALSPSGRFLYVISSWDEETGSLQGGIAVFRRNVHTGALVQLAGSNGCVTAQGLERCARARSIPRIGGTDVAVDRDGHHLYAASGNKIAAFDRLRGGGLRQLPGLAGCISHLGEGGCAPARTLENGVVGLAASPGGLDNLYATASFGVFGGASFNGAVANLVREPATGALSQPAGPAGCISSGGALGCASTHSEMLGPGAIAVSRDGRNAYAVLTVELGGDGVVAFRRNRSTGELAQLPGQAGCIAHNPPYTDCTDSRGLSATAIALSRDGRNAYVTSGGFAPGTIPGTGGVRPRAPDALAVYKRAR